MFDKLDDIIYEPVKGICNWVEEPLRRFSSERELKKMDKQADIEMKMQANAAELEAFNARQKAELEIDRKRWNAEIDQMIAEQEDARKDKLVEAIKNYQITLATATKDIVESMGLMSIELRRQANELVKERTDQYIALQAKAMDDAEKRLIEIGEKFASNERVRTRMEDSVINNMDTILENGDKFIKELSEDLKQLNQNTDILMNEGMQNINKYLAPMAQTLAINTSACNTSSDEIKQIEDGNIIDVDEFQE